MCSDKIMRRDERLEYDLKCYFFDFRISIGLLVGIGLRYELVEGC